MTSENQMDEFFNDRLRDYSSSVSADMWNRIVEKKKRDRKILLFFFGLFAVVILSLALTGGYFIFNQKRLTVNSGTGSTRINHAPIIADTIEANLSNLSSDQDHKQLPQINSVNKKTDKKEKTRVNYLDNFDQAKINTPENVVSSQTENTSESHSTQTDSNVTKAKNTEKRRDSLGKKPFVKAPASDSSRGIDLKKPEQEKKLNNRKWYLDLYASPDYPIIFLRENEQSKFSYSLGIKLNRSLGKHFSVKTGIQFSEVNIGSDSLSGGMTIHLMRLDLPVLAGYSLGDEKFRTTFNGGAILNLYTWLRGNAVPDFFKTNTGLSLYLGVNLERRINERISIFCEPYYRYQLTPMTVSSTFIDIAGINIGARYYFKK